LKAMMAARGVKPATASTTASRLAALGVTAAAVAAAIGLGFGINDLVNYFEAGANPDTGAPPGGTYVPPVGPVGPVGPVIPDEPYGPGGDGYGEERPWWSYTQNLTAKDLRGRGRRSSGRSDGRTARAAIVRQVMQEHGLGLIEASKYVKENGLY
jgi:hypothetical protein